jgi:prepilin-type N-terminal cleavage/methylation domain-containing protein
MKKRKSFKGMTLVEVMIAMAILAIAGSVMCTAVSMVCKVKITTNALNKRVSYEAPIAGSKITDTSSSKEIAGSYTYDKVVGTNPDGTDKKEKKENRTIVHVKVGTNDYAVPGVTYEVKSDGMLDYADSSNGIVSTTDHNFKFFVLD